MAPDTDEVIIKADPNVISPYTGLPYPTQSLDDRLSVFRRYMLQRYPDHFVPTFAIFGLDIDAIRRQPSPPKEVEVPSNVATPTEVDNVPLSTNEAKKAASPEADGRRSSKIRERPKRAYSPYSRGRRSRSPSPSRRNSSRRNHQPDRSDRRRRDSPVRRRRRTPSPARSKYITTTPPAGAVKDPPMEDLEKLTIQISNYPADMTLDKLASIFIECGPICDVRQIRTSAMRFNTAYVQFWLPESLQKVSKVAITHRLNVVVPTVTVSEASDEKPNDSVAKNNNDSAFDAMADDSPIPETATECLFLSDFCTSVIPTDSREEYAILARESLLFTVQQVLQDNHGIVHIYPFRQPSLLGRIAVKCSTVAQANLLQKYLTIFGHTVIFVPPEDYLSAFSEALTKPCVQTVSNNYQAFRDNVISRKKFFELEEGSRQKRSDQFLDFFTEMQVCDILAAGLKKEDAKTTTMGPTASLATPAQKAGVFNFGIKINLACNTPVKKEAEVPISLDARIEEAMDVDSENGSEKSPDIDEKPSPENVETKMDVMLESEKLTETIAETNVDTVLKSKESNETIAEDHGVAVKSEAVEMMDATVEDVETPMDEAEKPKDSDVFDTVEQTVEAKDPQVDDVDAKTVKPDSSIKQAITPEVKQEVSDHLKPIEAASPIKSVPAENTEIPAPKVDVIPASTGSTSQTLSNDTAIKDSSKKASTKPNDKITRSIMRVIPKIMSNRELDSALDKLTELEKLIKTDPKAKKPVKPTVKTLHMFPWKSIVQDTVKKAVNKDELWSPFCHILAKEEAQLLAADENYAAGVAANLASSRGKR